MPLMHRVSSSGRRYGIVGTAGHIDHGKSSLVKALTGTDPDRLPEEQARGMTIELGYANLDLDENGSQRHLGIVDVPGHERFVRTMVAGATGIDIALLVVAADDGVMPQTREHVDILDLLGVKAGLVALSKIDIAGSDRVQSVTQQIKELSTGTSLATWPVVPCSAATGKGLDEIRRTLTRLMDDLPLAGASPIFHLAIDRVFSIHGRGLVVTGSVLSGTVAAGASLDLMPAKRLCKVREVQSHHAAVSGAGSGQRAALNLTGVDRDEIDRGMELATPGFLEPTRYADARVRILGRISRPIPSHARVRVCMGTREELASFVVIGGDEIAPGQTGDVQLRFHAPVVCAFGQRFILRNETAQATIGGGTIVRPVSRRIRPRDAAELESVRRAASADVGERFAEARRRAGFEVFTDLKLACQIGCDPDEIAALREWLRKSGALVSVISGLEIHRDALEALEHRTSAFLKRHHAANPGEPGMLRDRLVTWLESRTARGVGKAVLASMESSGLVQAKGPYIADRSFRPAMSAEDEGLLERIIAEVSGAKWDPPLCPALRSTTGLSRQRSQSMEDLVKANGSLVLIAPQHYIDGKALEEFKAAVQRVGAGRRFKLAEVRDAVQLSRRAVQPLLEYLDRIGLTRRVGDERVLVEQSR